MGISVCDEDDKVLLNSSGGLRDENTGKHWLTFSML